MIEAAIYKALGDPIRLEIVRRLAVMSSSTVGDISTNLGVSRQGARKQIQVLANANVVHLKQHGRQTQVTLDKESLQIARSFISQLERQWDDRLNALKDYVEGAE